MKLPKKFPEIKFVWVGTGDLKNKLTSNNIEVTGWKNRDELMEILNKSDVFILPSLWEGLPISLLEAMALKKPCIVSNVIGNRDVISNENNGFVCNNLNEFIEVIKNIQDNKYNLEKISENAFNDVKNIYNTDVMCKKYCNIYKGEMNYAKKVGIVSCYFKHNYGSMLQAYATQKILDDMNIENETINIDKNIDFSNGKKKYYMGQVFNFQFIKSKLGMIKLKLDKKINKNLGKNISIRDKKYEEFRKILD